MNNLAMDYLSHTTSSVMKFEMLKFIYEYH